MEGSFENMMMVGESAKNVQATFLPSVPLTITAVVVVVSIIVLLVVLVLMLREQRRVLISPASKEMIQEAQRYADAIVAEAVEEARAVRADIEKDRLAALTEDKKEIERFIEAYSTRLDKAIEELGYGLEKEHMRATGHFVDSLQNIEKKVAQNAEDAKQSMDSFTTQSSALFERLAAEISSVENGIQHLAVALEEAASNEADKNAEIVREEMRHIGEQTAKSVTEVAQGLDEEMRRSLAQEFSTITKEIDAYRKARMDLVDERLLVLIEETAQIALQKKLNMAEQSELVFRALEEAKQKGIFV
jgi:hypothetical protein